RKVTVVEHKQKLATVAFQSLERMRNSGRKVPKIAFADIVLKGATFLVDRGNSGSPFEHVGPFGCLMPMHLSHAAGLEAHIDARKLRSGRQFANGSLPAPAARRQMHVTIGKRPSEISERAVVRRRRKNDVAILGFA